MAFVAGYLGGVLGKFADREGSSASCACEYLWGVVLHVLSDFALLLGRAVLAIVSESSAPIQGEKLQGFILPAFAAGLSFLKYCAHVFTVL